MQLVVYLVPENLPPSSDDNEDFVWFLKIQVECMAPKYIPTTEAYRELWEVVKRAREAELPGGGRKMGDDMWWHFVHEVAEGDQKLDRPKTETSRLMQQVESMDSFTIENHAQLREKQLELREIELRV